MRRLLIVLALVAGVLLIGSPAFAQPSGGCAIPPEPDRPGSGLVGLLDPTPPGTGDPATVYGEVGYAGMTWRTYDLCNRPDATSASTDTWVGNTLFNAAKVIVGAANGLHYQLGSADQLDGLDELLHAGVGAMYRSVFTTWVGVAVLGLAIGLLWLAARGDLAQQAQRILVAVGALALGGLVYAAPVSLLKASDAVLFDGVTQMQQGFLTELGVGDRDTLPETLTQEIVYANWVRGEFGSSDVPQARDLGRDLLRAQTFTRAEIAAGQDTAEAAGKKKQQFTEVTKKLGDRLAAVPGHRRQPRRHRRQRAPAGRHARGVPGGGEARRLRRDDHFETLGAVRAAHRRHRDHALGRARRAVPRRRRRAGQRGARGRAGCRARVVGGDDAAPRQRRRARADASRRRGGVGSVLDGRAAGSPAHLARLDGAAPPATDGPGGRT